MLFAVDVYYSEKKAKAVGLLIENWNSSAPIKVITSYTENLSEYKPGHFYKRELPCILDLLKQIDVNQIDTIIIDGYVFLSKDCAPGLGYHLYDALKKKVPIIGVAKTAFHGNDPSTVKDVCRGKSAKPLFVTAVGIELTLAAEYIQKMAGEHRIPSILRLLDSYTKSGDDLC